MDLIQEMQYWKYWNIFKMSSRAVLFTFYLATAIYYGYRLVKRYQARVRAMIRSRLQEEDQEQQIANAPPFVREGIDKIEIESFACSKCETEARNIIYLPCKHCYLCYKCYENKENKFECDRCAHKINALIRIYVSNN